MDTDILDLSFFEKKGKLLAPFEGVLAQGFGMVVDPKYQYRLSHKGHRYRSRKAKPAKAVADGRIVFSGEVEGYGPTAIIDHGDHYFSVYSGLKDVKVSKGDEVTRAQALSSSIKEIYFEIRHFSDAIDPASWIKR